MSEPHFLVVTFPAQGHLNPALQFAKSLMRIGARVTLSTTTHAKHCMSHSTLPHGLSLAAFLDGFDDGFKPKDDRDGDYYMAQIERRGSQTLSDLIEAAANEAKPFTCLVYSLLLPWAPKVARAHHIPSTLLWIQPATVLDIYYFYFNGYQNMYSNCSDSSYALKLPGELRAFTRPDLSSFLVPGNPYSSLISIFKEHLKVLMEEEKPKVLVNTFGALEVKPLKAIESIKMIEIGPLLPSAFLDGKDPSDISFGGDLFQSSKDNYVEWLNSKEEASVVYISFGSIAMLSKKQMEEIGKALLKSEYPFLWVIREEEEEKLSCREELEEKGMIIPWCSQVQVLSHRALGCFVTHCGWNLTLESIVMGIPVVAFPQWMDQGTNAKLIEEEWKIGVRVVPNEELGVVESEEIRRCLDMVMAIEQGGDKIGQEVRNNAKKWKELAREAVMDNGSSDINLRAFVDHIVPQP